MIQHLVLCNSLPFVFPSVYSGCFFFSKNKQILLGKSAYIPGIVQVKNIACAHGQDLTVVGIHDNGCRNLAARGGLPFIDVFLYNILDIHINGGNNGLAALCRLHHALQVGVLVQVSVLPSVHPNKAAVIVLLNPSCSHAAVTAGKSDHIAGQGIIGIDPFIFIFKPDPLDPLFSLHLVLVLIISFVHILCQLLKGSLLVIG